MPISVPGLAAWLVIAAVAPCQRPDAPAPLAERLAELRRALQGSAAEVIAAAARDAESLGSAALPLRDPLLHQLETQAGWLAQAACARALAAIGARDPEVADSLIRQITLTRVPALVQQCAEALDRLVPDAAERILAAVEAERFATADNAVSALYCLGERAAEPAIASLRGAPGRARVARTTLEQIGWRIVPHLERAGLTAMVDEVLRTGPLRRVAFGDAFVARWTDAPPAVLRLPTLRWESGHGHGHNLVLAHAEENERGLAVTAVRVAMDQPPKVSVSTTTVPRDRAFALARQLLAIAHTTVEPKEGAGDHDGVMSSTANFHARVLASFDREPGLDAVFTDYPASDNLVARFRPEAAVAVLWEATLGAPWIEREPTEQDRSFVAACLRDRPKSDTWWVTERLAAIATALDVR